MHPVVSILTCILFIKCFGSNSIQHGFVLSETPCSESAFIDNEDDCELASRLICGSQSCFHRDYSAKLSGYNPRGCFQKDVQKIVFNEYSVQPPTGREREDRLTKTNLCNKHTYVNRLRFFGVVPIYEFLYHGIAEQDYYY